MRLDSEDTAELREFWPALRDPRVATIGLVIFGVNVGVYGYLLWLPQIVQGMGFSNRATGLVVALPLAAGVVSMILWGRSSDASGERIWHTALAILFAAAGFVMASLVQSNLLALTALTLVAIGLNAFYGPFWSLPSTFLRGPAAAGGIALVNAVGALGGLLGPTIIGVLKELTGGYGASMAILAGALVLSALLVLTLGRSLGSRILASGAG